MSFSTEQEKTIIENTNKHEIAYYGALPSKGVQLPEKTVILLATGALHKLEEWKRITRFHSPNIHLANALIALTDSQELEKNAVDIAIGKINITLREEFNQMSKRDMHAVYDAAGIDSDTLVLEAGEDRYTILIHPEVRDHPAFAAYKDHPLVDEVFSEGSDFPSYRIKELMDAMGGQIEFLKALQTATEDFRKKNPAKYEAAPQKHECIAVAIRAHNPEMLPEGAEALKDGIVVTAVQKNGYFTFPTAERIAKLKAQGKHTDMSMDNFDHVDGEKGTIEELRRDLKNPYFDIEFPLALAWNTFANMYNIPRLEVPRELNPKIIVPNATILTNSKTDRKKLPKGALRPNARVYQHRIKSLADLEATATSAHGMLLQKPHRFKERKDMSQEQRDLKYLARKVEALLRFTDYATQKSIYNPHYKGKPLIIDKYFNELAEPLAASLHYRKATPAKPSQIYSTLGRVRPHNLEKNLIWDAELYEPIEGQLNPPKFVLASKKDLMDATGITDFGYSFGIIGSASLGLPKGREAVHDVAYLGAKHGMTIVDGGGTRFHTIMGAMLEGTLDAYIEGHRDFNHIGIRVPICSRREGSIKQFLIQAEQQKHLSMAFTHGNENSFHSVINDNFHFLTYDTLAERQHPILGLSDAVVMGIGGFGTKYEFFTTALNNLYVKRDILKMAQGGHKRPEGIFPGFKTAIRPVFADNAQFNGNRNNRFYSFMRDIFTPEELDMMELTICDHGGEEIFEKLQEHKASLGPAIS